MGIVLVWGKNVRLRRMVGSQDGAGRVLPDVGSVVVGGGVGGGGGRPLAHAHMRALSSHKHIHALVTHLLTHPPSDALARAHSHLRMPPPPNSITVAPARALTHNHARRCTRWCTQENDLLTSQQEETDRELQRLHRQLEEQKQAAVRMAQEEGTALMRAQQEVAQMKVRGGWAGLLCVCVCMCRCGCGGCACVWCMGVGVHACLRARVCRAKRAPRSTQCVACSAASGYALDVYLMCT